MAERIRRARIHTGMALKKIRAPRRLVERVWPGPRLYRKDLVVSLESMRPWVKTLPASRQNQLEAVKKWLDVVRKNRIQIFILIAEKGPAVFEEFRTDDPELNDAITGLQKWSKRTLFPPIFNKARYYYYIAVNRKGDLVLTRNPNNAIIGELPIPKRR
ncbi:MAG TPA: hypothetical protein VI977_05970 [archaeon]|nr:hypothetical protein [archaeon]